MNTARAASRIALVILIAGSLWALGCGGGGSGSGLSGGFTASATATSPGLVKLIKKSSSGSHVVISAVIYGPLSADLYSFAFDLVTGNGTTAKLVANSASAGDALMPTGGQTVQAVADVSSSDTTHVVVGVTKLGGGLGNGITGNSATIVNVTFALQVAGTTSLAIAASPAPQALDSNGAPIGSVSFDTVAGTLRGTSTGGGGY
jgi:hypothetical protein